MWELYRTRPWGRVQRHRADIPCDLVNGFNPHPPVGAGATMDRPRDMVHPRSVSILTRPWGRVQRLRSVYGNGRSRFQSSPARGGGCNGLVGGRRRVVDVVSILTRPWGRVQPKPNAQAPRKPSGFQSSPARGGGCNVDGAADLRVNLTDVSILTRPWGRVQPVSVSPCRIHSALFQSSPARGGGCNHRSARRVC